MKRQISCNHFKEEVKKTSVYEYKLIGSELNLCNKCEKKLRKQVLEQDSIEKEMDIKMKEWDKNERKNKGL